MEGNYTIAILRNMSDQYATHECDEYECNRIEIDTNINHIRVIQEDGKILADVPYETYEVIDQTPLEKFINPYDSKNNFFVAPGSLFKVFLVNYWFKEGYSMDNNEQIERERHGLCVICGAEMKWGKFAHNQNTCFDCFKQEVNEIMFFFPVRSKERDILNWMMAIVAEQYGYEW